MKITCLADLHGYYPELSGGDLLIVAGDLTRRDTENEVALFDYWINEQSYNKKIVIAGNHDNVLAENRIKLQFCEYLCDSGTEITYYPYLDPQDPDKMGIVYKRKTLKIWGSPWSLWFQGINPRCKAFTGSEKDLAKKFDLIPDDIDILITHSPPYGILDRVKKYNSSSYHNVGSKALAEKVGKMEKLPKLLVWGHIHECYGIDLPVRGKPCIMLNASHVNEHYQPVNKPIDIVL